MNKKIKILHLEDLRSDAELVNQVLKRGNLDFETLVVDTREKFINALTAFSPDIILSDHSLPSFNSQEALEIFRETGVKVPFILITGTMPGEFAADILKRSVDDYILKDRLTWLPSAIHNSMEKFRLEKERQYSLDELTKNKHKFRALIENSTVGETILSAEGKMLYISPSVKNVLGYTEEELLQMDLFVIAHPDDIAALANVMKQVLANPGISIKGHTGRKLHKDGTWRWLEATLTNLLHDPSIKGIVYNFRDITDRKLDEEKLYHANRLYAFISQINQAIVHSEDEQTVFKEACHIAIEAGKFKAAWIGMIDLLNQEVDLIESAGIPGAEISKFRHVCYQNNGPQYQVLHTSAYYICNNIQHDLELMDWKKFAADKGYGSCMVLPIRKSGRIIGTFNLYAAEINFFNPEEIALLEEVAKDISFALDVFEKTKLKLQADDLVRHKELHLNQAQAIAHLGSWELSFSTGIITWSEEALRIHGLSREEGQQTYESWISFIHPDDLDHVLRVTKEAESTLSNSSLAYRIIRKDGTLRNLFSQAHFEFNNEGKPIGLYGVVHDITEMKEAEAALRDSETNLQAIFENTSEGFILADKNGIVKSFNNKSKDIIRLNTEKEIRIGESIFDFVHESRKGNYRNVISKVLAGENLQYDYPYERKDSEIKWFNFTINPVYRAGEIEGVCITSADITERKKVEELLQSSQSNLKAIIENTDATIYSLDKNFKYITFNLRHQVNLKETYGLDIKPGDNVFNFLEKSDPAEALKWREIYSKALKGETVKFEKEFNFDNIYSCTSFSIHPIWENKKVIGLSCYTLDITKQKQTSDALRQSEFQYRQIVETAQEGIWLIDENNRTTFVNKKMCDILEYSEEEMLGKENLYFMDDTGKGIATAMLGKRKSGIRQHIDLRFITKSGKNIWTTISANPIFDDHANYKGTLAMVSDITGKKNLETLLDKSNKLAAIGSWEIDVIKGTVYWSDITKEIREVEPDFVPQLENGISLFKEGRDKETISQKVRDCIEKATPWDEELQIITHKGKLKWVRTIGEGEFVMGKCLRIYGSFQDIDTRKKAEIEVLKVYEEKNIILESIGDAFFAVDKQWVVTYWNKEAEKMLHTPKNKIIGNNLWEIFSDSIDSESYIKYHEALETNGVIKFEDYYAALEKWFEISAYPSPTGLSVFFKDITERKLSEIRLKQLNEKLQKHARDLAVSNKELEDFAYVASHDLQEPLRMVTGFLAQIDKKYGDIIDDKGKLYIHFAIDGAKRMRQIILDLLEFSRVGRMEEKEEQVDLNEVMREVILLCRKQIKETDAIINFDDLPLLQTYKAPLRQVFQNLVSNALKYHKEQVPAVINISVEETPTYWLFTVKDNGIGMEKEYFDKIFIIFQRLHNKDEYSGTGIGLAICKKIIENMGGNIWVESEVGVGCTFYFTLLKKL